MALHARSTRSSPAWRPRPLRRRHPASRCQEPIVDALAGRHGGPRLVFVNGSYRRWTVRSATALVAGPALRAGEARAPMSRLPLRPLAPVDGFIARNGASGHDVAVVEVDPGTQAPRPVHIVHLAMPDSRIRHGARSRTPARSSTSPTADGSPSSRRTAASTVPP